MITGLWVLTKLSAGAEERRHEAIRKLSDTGVSTTNTVTCINSGITLACDLAGGRLAVVRPGTSVVFIPADMVIKIMINLDGRTIVKIDNLSAAAGGFIGGALAGKNRTIARHIEREAEALSEGVSGGFADHHGQRCSPNDRCYPA